ncbi:LIM and SH3 domain protein 1-like isoform X2 [Xiphophorus maculatus]|uniref:LIM and SH3 domain protein 1-like isoform X2 n=1 Tax=Xiphophorus maculatus TaxID=8083 RepID=UPI000C6D4F05|nr:LIM and SH3 domain protein 1-like isoform X2 [Xiphophorus maculatus]XP_027885983.1 LIM and SH3 domain protein 1-like isoform X2 [Xiphophorus couchianus]
MNPPCGRCNKPVYPTEKINCLDKYWHKGCFSCEVCKMALSMNNYKGFEKKPYCTMHYPKTSFTIVTDTPENLRLKQQSLLNSQIKYHEEFEKSKTRSDAPPPENRQEQELQASNSERFNQPAGQMRPAVVSPPSGGKRYQALYSYVAAEADEVSLQEGDLVSDVEPIDEGWMFGCNQRTGKRGMLPANYVRPI